MTMVRNTLVNALLGLALVMWYTLLFFFMVLSLPARLIIRWQMPRLDWITRIDLESSAAGTNPLVKL